MIEVFRHVSQTIFYKILQLTCRFKQDLENSCVTFFHSFSEEKEPKRLLALGLMQKYQIHFAFVFLRQVLMNGRFVKNFDAVLRMDKNQTTYQRFEHLEISISHLFAQISHVIGQKFRDDDFVLENKA